MERLTVVELQRRLGVAVDGQFGPNSRAALSAKLSNRNAPALTVSDYAAVAARWGVPVAHIKGVRAVEAPRGPYDIKGRPSILFERHKFRNNTVPVGRFNATHPALSGVAYGPGGYGSFASQYDKFLAACALDPEAAFRACSWGAFQVLGENAQSIGYASAYDMVMTLTEGEGAHLNTFVRFVESKGLVDEFQHCRANDPASCIPFVSQYNGSGFRSFGYHKKLAAAIAD